MHGEWQMSKGSVVTAASELKVAFSLQENSERRYVIRRVPKTDRLRGHGPRKKGASW